MLQTGWGEDILVARNEEPIFSSQLVYFRLYITFQPPKNEGASLVLFYTHTVFCVRLKYP